MGKQVITADEILKAVAGGSRILEYRKKECIVTPGAWDKIEELGLAFSDDTCSSPDCGIQPQGALEPMSGDHSATDTKKIQSITDRVCAILKDKVPGTNSSELSAIVKSVVESKFAPCSAGKTDTVTSGVTVVGGVSLIDGEALLAKDSGPAIPGKVQISNAIRCHEDTHLTATFMQWEKSSFSRVVDSPEISIVVDGEMEIITDGHSMKAKAGDVLYMARGAKVEYITPSRVKLACVSS
ncbi:MAG: hypothetical protein RQ739_08565 [Desulfotignum sp.]|nr:hypothetical protein [Desulfotignum sp.]